MYVYIVCFLVLEEFGQDFILPLYLHLFKHLCLNNLQLSWKWNKTNTWACKMLIVPRKGDVQYMCWRVNFYRPTVKSSYDAPQ